MIGWLKNPLGGGAATGRLSPAEAHETRAGAIILDVRTPQKRQEGEIPGLQVLLLDKLASEEIICQCPSGSRSAQDARFLPAEVYNLKVCKRHKLLVK